MDTSETYIKMCDCPEIQEQRPRGNLYFEGDYAARRDHAGEWYITLCVPNYKGKKRSIYFKADDSIWLPMQDQLQGMVYEGDIGNLCDRFQIYLNEHWHIKSGIWWDKTSMEQLWLAFVMREKFNLTWNGDKWV